MSKTGKFVWQDLTVDNAEEVRDFYSQVVGWKFEPVSMGEYEDFNMITSEQGTEPIAGICHKRGLNANIPSQWLNYVTVKNVDESVKTCEALGGKVIDGPRLMGNHKFIVIQDPAGAYLGLIEDVKK